MAIEPHRKPIATREFIKLEQDSPLPDLEPTRLWLDDRFHSGYRPAVYADETLTVVIDWSECLQPSEEQRLFIKGVVTGFLAAAGAAVS